MADIDLKDLQILDTVYQTRNVSLAAQKVGLSQPSLSIRLGRLRSHFRDSLFVRTSQGMQPTPRVDALIPSIHQALALFDDSVRRLAVFEPRASERRFRICMTDVGQVVALPRLLKRIKSLAPGMRIEVLNLNAGNLDSDLKYLVGLANLRTLHLDQTIITNAAFDHLAKLPRLDWLACLQNPLISIEGAIKFHRSRENITIT